MAQALRIWDNLNGYDIILASQSPRRVELLAGLGISFRQEVIPNIDESYPQGLMPEEIVQHISRMKSAAYERLATEGRMVITADTIVVVQGEVLGKPKDKADAERMLGMLSGSEHRVLTAVTVLTAEGAHTFVDEALVQFAPLSAEEIDYYLEACRPYDKAGAYGIQEWVGYRAIERIEGSFYTVMGLPTAKLAKYLKTIKPYVG